MILSALFPQYSILIRPTSSTYQRSSFLDALRSFLLAAMLACSTTGAFAEDQNKEERLPPQTWAFTNGGQLTFDLDDGIYFKPKGGQKIKLISGKVKQFPGYEQKIIKEGLCVYKPSSEKTKIVFAEVDGKMVFITDSGLIEMLPMHYDKVKVDAKTIIYWHYTYCPIAKNGVEVQHLALSLGYTYPKKLDELKKNSTDMVDRLNSGETFLIREDGSFFQIDYRLHTSDLGNGFRYSDNILSFYGSDSTRSIDLNQFDKEAAFDVPYLPPSDNHYGGKADPVKYVSSFTTDLSSEVRRENLEHEPLDAETRDAFRRAFVKKELGNAVVLGPAGSGKTETVRRFVAEVVEGRIPEIPRSVAFLSIDPAGLGSGTRFTGNFESKVNAILMASEMMPIVWVMDEIHGMKGQGTHSENPNDFFQWIKPYLSSGKIKIIGMSTNDEFYRAFSYDNALMERFQIIEQKAPTNEETVAKYGSWAKKNKHPVPSEEVLKRVLYLSEEFNAIGAQPRKGIVLLNEAYADLEIRSEENRAPTVRDVEDAARRIYRLDPKNFEFHAIREKVRQLPEKLDQKVIGQKIAKEAIVRQATLSLLGTHDPEKPRMSIMLSGPKGVGKTEMAYTYAQAIGVPIERILMSRFSIQDQPTELLRTIKQALEKNAFTVFLLDEVDKAPRPMLDALLSIFDKGQFTLPEHNHSGRQVKSAEVSARNASFILAANAAVDSSRTKLQIGFSNRDSSSGNGRPSLEEFMDALTRDGISEYLVDRIQDCVFMDYLSKQEFREVLGMHYRLIVDQQSRKQGIPISSSNENEFLDQATETYYQPRMSSRAALRILQNDLRYAIAQGLLAGGDAPPKALTIVYDPSERKLRFVECGNLLSPQGSQPHTALPKEAPGSADGVPVETLTNRR